ncbi:restriction endonuclease [Streptomyces sp. NPDC056697]|uniref:restriction endonuclease n=1 Tax=Streptomyces sp. NPDC056697 TaxID=3345915 RepID=UPI0036BE817E
MDSLRPAGEWPSFESFVTLLFYRDLGDAFVRECGGRGDGGADLILMWQEWSPKQNEWVNSRPVIVQCKHTKEPRKAANRVGLSSVREMRAVALDHYAAETYIVTNGGFTRGAIEYSLLHDVRLIGRERLRRIFTEALRLRDAVQFAGSP